MRPTPPRTCWLTLVTALALACAPATSEPEDTGKDDDDKGEESPCANEAAEGYRTFTDNGVTREYVLKLPSGYDPSTAAPLPLILNFHGNGGCASDFAQGSYDGPSDLSDVMAAHDVIVAYPQGVVRDKGATEWDPGRGTESNMLNDDVYFAQQLIADLTASHPIDTTRIYALGYSNGGMMAYGLACGLDDQIAAIGIMSGIMLEGSCDASNPTPVIHLHGTADDALPYAGDASYPSVADVISFWVNHNEIPKTTPTSTTLNDGAVTFDAYTGGAEDSAVHLYTIDGGGHVWFGEDIDGQSPNALLWAFLSGFTLDGAR